MIERLKAKIDHLEGVMADELESSEGYSQRFVRLFHARRRLCAKHAELRKQG